MNKKSMKEYRIWKAMKSRCYSPSQKDSYYQRDGIKVCDRWIHNFKAFLQDMGPMPANDYSIERIDIYGDYCPENCIWIPEKDQKKNRRNVPIYSYNNENHCLKEWSEILGFNLDCVRGRIRRGMSFEEAITNDPYYRIVEINGEKKTVTEWCIFYHLNAGSVFSRINRGWSKVDAILKNQQDIVQR